MRINERSRRLGRSRRGFVRGAAHTVLGLMTAAAMRPAEATSGNSQTAPSIDSTNMGNNDMTLSLHEISDRLQIEELLVRYCYAVDDRDWVAYRNVFTPDAMLDDTVTGGVRSGVE